MAKIKAKNLAEDIRARVSDFELMSKYGLSLEQLEKVLEKLVEAGTLRKDEIKERGPFFDSPANRLKTRGSPRTKLKVPLDIEDLNNSANKGRLVDLSDDGFRTRGLAAIVGEEKIFFVSLQGVRKKAVRLRARCLWIRKEADARELQEAGFKIVYISDDDFLEMRRVTGLVIS